MTRAAVVVVNYNTSDVLRACLATVPAGTETIVVDNASTDGSAAMVRTEFPDVRLLANAANAGYGSAANQGIRACAAQYVLVLNSDTRLDDGALRTIEQYLDAHPEVALVGPRLRNGDGSLQPSCFPFPGTWAWLVENKPVAPLLGRLSAARERMLCFSPPETAAPVPWVLGAVMGIRREPFEAVGGFDEAFFMYYEEVDLCRRLRRAGYDIHYVPDAGVVHLGAATTSQVREAMVVEHQRSTLRYYRRYYRGPRRQAWLLIMRAKLAGRLVRDAAELAVAREAAQQERLREDVNGWRRALWLNDR
ncbi:MAG TPA: glycosyltransferase family 2 protein [Longimicrobiales bacterium]|nr:glycosyltransferase family 2 protein [Longimicrobiales bacterium]